MKWICEECDTLCKLTLKDNMIPDCCTIIKESAKWKPKKGKTPVTFGWPEALKRLQRGEKVKVADEDGDFAIIKPLISTESFTAGVTQVRLIGDMKDKRFTDEV